MGGTTTIGGGATNKLGDSDYRGGYYAGGTAGSGAVGYAGSGGGGGSSYISGHSGCDSITETSTSTNIVHTGSANHYSGYVFTNTKMIDGSRYIWTNVKGPQEQMPNPEGVYFSLGQGNSGHGYAKITFLGD